jgi:hypothetical protein
MTTAPHAGGRRTEILQGTKPRWRERVLMQRALALCRPRMAPQLRGDGTNIAEWGFEVLPLQGFQRVARGKNVTRGNFYVMSVAASLELHPDGSHCRPARRIYHAGRSSSLHIIRKIPDGIDAAFGASCFRFMRRRNGLMASSVMGMLLS